MGTNVNNDAADSRRRSATASSFICRSFRGAAPRRALCSTAAAEEAEAASPAAKEDPFRPAKHPVDPVIINLVLRTVVEGKDLDAALDDFRARRVQGGGDSSGTEEEEEEDDDELLGVDEFAVVEERTRGVAASAAALGGALEAAAAAAPWITKYKMQGDYGLPAPPADPLAALNRAECLLALWMLHVAPGAPLPVPFVDDEKAEVLAHPDAAAAAAAAAAVPAAVAESSTSSADMPSHGLGGPLGSFALNVNLYVKPERRAEFLQCIGANQRGTLTTEPLACVYVWGESTAAPNTFHFHEQYLGKEGFDAHCAAPHFADWEAFAATDPFTKDPEVTFFELN